MVSTCPCRAAAASANSPATENNEKLKLQLRQAQQMAAAVARKKEDMVMKLKRLTDKQVCTYMLVACKASIDILGAIFPCPESLALATISLVKLCALCSAGCSCTCLRATTFAVRLYDFDSHLSHRLCRLCGMQSQIHACSSRGVLAAAACMCLV